MDRYNGIEKLHIFGQLFNQFSALGTNVLTVWHDVSRQRQQLRHLSQEQLEDVGIARADARREGKRAFWDLPQAQLATLSDNTSDSQPDGFCGAKEPQHALC